MAGINGIDKNFNNSKARAKAIEEKDITYYSGGQLYLTENGRQVVRSWDRLTGHDVIKDLRNGKIYYDLTEIQKEKEKIKSIKEGKTVYRIHKKDEGVAWSCKNRTGIYCINRDIETNHLVCEIGINKYMFYFDVFDGKLLRLSDGGIKSLNYLKNRGALRYEPLDYDDIIYYFNKRQDRLKKHKNYNYSGNEWMKKVFYLSDKIICHRQLFMNENGKLVYANTDRYKNEELIEYCEYGEVNMNTGDYI